jgi:hypothetical protein
MKKYAMLFDDTIGQFENDVKTLIRKQFSASYIGDDFGTKTVSNKIVREPLPRNFVLMKNSRIL